MSRIDGDMSEFSIDLSTVVHKPCFRAYVKVPHTVHIYLSQELPEDEGFYARCEGVEAPPPPTVDEDFNTFLRILNMGAEKGYQAKDMETLLRLADLGIKARELLADEETLGNTLYSVFRSYTTTDESCEIAAQWAAETIVTLAKQRGLQ